MKFLILSMFLRLLLLVVVVNGLTDADKEAWESFKLKHFKNYNLPEEDKLRMNLFLKIKKEVEEHNAKFDQGEFTWKAGLNRYADWTEEEKQKLRAFGKQSRKKNKGNKQNTLIKR